MPELPEVESVRRQLAPRLEGRRVLAIEYTPQPRFDAVDRVAGTRVTHLERRGKYLIAGLAEHDGPAGAPDASVRDGAGGGEAAAAVTLELVMHLGMTGSFRFRGDAEPGGAAWQPDAYVRATFTLDDAVLDFRDVRRFGRLSVVPAGCYAAIPTLAGLGPEPLSDAFDPDAFAAALRASLAPVKAVLLNQRVVAGVGNIYADEALWRARIHPRSRRVGPARARRLWEALRTVLAEAVDREGTTFRDYLMVNGASGRYAEALVAYGQHGRPCPRCATPLRKVVVAGRGTTYCPACQRA